MWPETHQGAGLLGFVRGQGPRLLPVPSHPGATLELELLWQLARHLQHMGHDTLVLDASANEDAQEPGLAQWLDAGAGGWPEQGQECVVVPAARGVADLALLGGASALAFLAGVVRHFSFVLLYAPPAQVADLFEDQDVSPLVLNVPGDAGLLRSYAVIKQLAGLGRLHCTVAAVAPRADQLETARHTMQVLRERCRQWLGMSPRTVVVDGGDDEAFAATALQLMEAACTLQAPPGRGARAAPVSCRAITRYHEHSVV